MVELNVGDIFRTTTEVIMTNLGTFIALIVIIALPNFAIEIGSSLLTAHITPDLVQSSGPGSEFDALFAGLAVFLPVILVSIVVTIFTYIVAQAGMTFTAIEHMAGRRADVGSAISAGFRSIGSLLVGGFLVGLVTVLGMFLCLVPGVLAALYFCLTTPAILAERLGPIAGMERSAALTEGHKMTIFLVFLALFGLAIIVSMCIVGPLAGVAALDTSGALGRMADPLHPVSIATNLVGVVVNGTLSAFGTTTVAVIYGRIRGLREGMDTAAYASVFA